MARNFAIIGTAGYIAPRHLRAIQDTGNQLVAALDKSDSVGILDRFFMDVPFFTEFERFDRYAEKLKRMDEASRIHYVSICSPNYLHDAHVRFALRIGADAICEKPLVIKPWNLDALEAMETESGRRIHTVLQLRSHEAILALRRRIQAEPAGTRHAIDLTYVTARGRWYFQSWKGDPLKSGGIATNIGIHFFDMLLWIFGPASRVRVLRKDPHKTEGLLELERASVRWFLSVDQADLPPAARGAGNASYRSLLMDGEEISFSEGFTDLHTQVYRDVLAGRGFGVKDARPSVELAHRINQMEPELG